VTGTGPSLEDALALYDLGLAPVPAPADDGKSVRGAVAGFNKWRRRPSRAATEDLFRKNPGANVAILLHLCRPPLVVVDRDDVAADAAEQRHGPEPPLLPRARRRAPSKVGGGNPCRARSWRVRQPGEQARGGSSEHGDDSFRHADRRER
jgi:hypothetical protein